MRLQTAVGDDVAGESRLQRLDPFALPVSFAVSPRGSYPGAAAVTVTLDRDNAVLSRPGRLSAESVPIKSYRGVAVRVVPATEANPGTLVVELSHERPSLSLPLLSGNTPEDVAVDWQAWSRSLGLPLLLVEADGTMTEPLSRVGELMILDAKPRRRRFASTTRRPRFLVRRKTGWDKALGKIDGDELFARD